MIDFSSSEVPQANMFIQAHDFQINDGVFNNIVSHQLVGSAPFLRLLLYYRPMTTENFRPRLLFKLHFLLMAGTLSLDLPI